MINYHRKYILIFLSIILIAGGCATYYKKTLKFQEFILNGELEKAKKYLDKNDKDKTNKNKLLYYMYSGWVSWMMDMNKESNSAFAKADNIIEDQKKNYGLEALSLISNPSVKPYKPEDFEIVLINYFKALNYLNTGQYNEALVECRKINIKLNQLNDKYKEHKNRYSDDAFAHVIMGLIYDANKEYNDAFIAYRNAVEVYEKSYLKNFNIKIPEQLKWDLLRAAYRTGFYEELHEFEKKFNLKYEHKSGRGGELVFIWQNGLVPVKSEWSINFTKIDGEGGMVIFANNDMGIAFPFYIGDKSDDEKSAFAELSFLRVAFPKYLERKPVFKSAEISANNNKYPLYLAEDINSIAFKTLHDRMLREMANSLLRLATKKAMETAVRNENQDAGAAIGIINALTEKADTRNWQTLPYEIYYTRIFLPEGENTVELNTKAVNSSETQSFVFNIKRGKTYFQVFQSLESMPLPDRH
ncbi:MAG: hypothetical protein K8R58_00410 [Bacteroidales bacterium]|nr:hypothetical protein [Bacteroidales bacterium]